VGSEGYVDEGLQGEPDAIQHVMREHAASDTERRLRQQPKEFVILMLRPAAGARGASVSRNAAGL